MSVTEPGLRKLASAYFNQDWDLDGTADEALRRFATGHPDRVVERTLQQIDDVLASDRDEAQLRHLWLDEYRSNLEPEAVGMTYRQWFEHMKQVLGT